MADDVRHDLVVAPEAAALQARIGPRAMQLRRFEERGVFRRSQHGGGIGIRTERGSRPDVDHPRVDRGAAQVPRHRDSVVAVDDVVVVVHLVHVDRRELIALDHRLVDPGPAVARAPVDGEPPGIEVTGLAVRRDRAHDLVDRDLLHTAERAAFEAGRVQHRLDRAQPLRSPGEDRANAAPERARTRGIEVLEGANAFHAQYERPLTTRLTAKGVPARSLRRRSACCGCRGPASHGRLARPPSAGPRVR